MSEKPTFSEFNGKTVERIVEWHRTSRSGDLSYLGYIIYFADGTFIRFRGNSNADIEASTE